MSVGLSGAARGRPRNYRDVTRMEDDLVALEIVTSNASNESLPNFLTFNDDSLREVVIYSILFVFAAAGNVPVFVSLLRNRRHRKSRIKLMILHLAIADLIVTFVMIPLEIFWRITVEWLAGNAVCKIMLFLRAFGPYLSSMVLVCISLDRYFAILHPLKVNDAQRRSKVMLILAWTVSIVWSAPQEEEDLEGCLGVEPKKQVSTDSPQVLFSSIKKNPDHPTEPLEKLLLVSVDIQTESEPVVSCEVFQRTISRRLVANGLHSCRPLRRLPLTPPNRRQRLEWCQARSTWMTEWHRVVFSDESRFCLSSDSRHVRVWRRRGERSNPEAIVERPTVRQRGIMVWGAIAYDSRSPLLRIQGTMTAQRYVDDVLRPVTLPYLQGVPNALYQ
ncbi:GNRHR [Cordylochernes scorpioides]|uniref:GNRHR n=1 Tax=Cordylochernes scorpioides TaxID=51811 RepID=A0ABY6JZZ9_9ARAC|nr:GNRHR [Cordylochernes scorpioides]